MRIGHITLVKTPKMGYKDTLCGIIAPFAFWDMWHSFPFKLVVTAAGGGGQLLEGVGGGVGSGVSCWRGGGGGGQLLLIIIHSKFKGFWPKIQITYLHFQKLTIYYLFIYFSHLFSLE